MLDRVQRAAYGVLSQINKRSMMQHMMGLLGMGCMVMVLLYTPLVQAQVKPASRLDQLVQNSASSVAAVRVREGRDLIADEKWARAEQKFLEVVNKHPGSAYDDAAMYWLSFAYKKQGKLQDADNMLIKLAASHPRSSWINDAKSMRMEMAPQLGRGEDVAAEARNAQNDEIKVVALQSLFQANPDRAMQFTQDILAPASTAGYLVKEGALTLLGRFKDYDQGPKATKILLMMAQQEPNEKLRQKAIYHLGRGEWSEAKFSFDGDDKIVPTLADLAMQADNFGVADAAIEAIAHIENHVADPGLLPALVMIAQSAPSEKVRQRAINELGQVAEKSEGSGVDLQPILTHMISIMASNQDENTKTHILSVISKMKTQAAHKFIFKFARSGHSKDLRRRAIYIIGTRGNMDSMQMLTELYDAEVEQEMKRMMISTFSQSKHLIGLEKLMTIAKMDNDMKLRMEAVTFLGRSKSPEAQKFLEELLK